MTHPLSCSCERISPEDVAVVQRVIEILLRNSDCRTYDFNITSDSVPQWEETHS